MKHKISIATSGHGVVSVEEFLRDNLEAIEVYGIVVQTETIGLIMSLDSWKEKWGDKPFSKMGDGDCNGEAKSLQELSGLELTKRIIVEHAGHNEMYAAKRCWEYDCEGLQWYLPSLYELGTIAAYKDEINAILEKISLESNALVDDYHWSSSEFNQYSAWYVHFSIGNFLTIKYGSIVVRAVSAFSPLTQRSDLTTMSDEQIVIELRKRGFAGELTKSITV